MVHIICSLKFNGPNQIPVVFHSGSNYDYHFIITKLTKQILETIWITWKIYRNVQNRKNIDKKVINIDKDGNERVVTISYKIKFIDSARIIASSLSNRFYNLAEGIHKSKFEDCDC